MEDKSKSSYLCSPIRKENGFAFFFYNYSFPFARESEKRVGKENKKTSEKVWKINLKVLIFAVRFAKKTVLLFSFIIILSLSQESLRNELKKKIKKTSENIWQLKINPLPLHPLLKRKQQVL